MNISAKTEYACLAVLELAANFETGLPLRARSIAERQHIPARFLVQILLQLKAAGLVSSTRGANGGYALAHPPAEVTLGQVMRLMEGEAGPLLSNLELGSPGSRVLLEIWNGVAAAQYRMLSEITFAELVQRAGSRGAAMYYI